VRSQARPSAQDASLISPYQWHPRDACLLKRRVKMKKVKLTVFVTVLARVCWRQPLSRQRASTIALNRRSRKGAVGAKWRTLYLFTADKGRRARATDSARRTGRPSSPASDRGRRAGRVDCSARRTQGREAAGHLRRSPRSTSSPSTESRDTSRARATFTSADLVDRLGCGAKVTTKP